MTEAIRVNIINLDAYPLDLELSADQFLDSVATTITTFDNLVNENTVEITDENAVVIAVPINTAYELPQLNANPMDIELSA